MGVLYGGISPSPPLPLLLRKNFLLLGLRVCTRLAPAALTGLQSFLSLPNNSVSLTGCLAASVYSGEWVDSAVASQMEHVPPREQPVLGERVSMCGLVHSCKMGDEEACTLGDGLVYPWLQRHN